MGVVTGAPVGTIALLFTDIEGSTRLASELGGSWPGVLAEHHAIVGGAIAAEGGFVDGTEGDAFFATFVDVRAAARAAVAALRGLRSHSWPEAVGELRVRMGLHVGFVERAGTGYVGLEVHRAARVAAAARGGQLLITGPARALVGDQVVTEPLGAHRLKDFPSPELLFCAVVDGRGASSDAEGDGIGGYRRLRGLDPDDSSWANPVVRRHAEGADPLSPLRKSRTGRRRNESRSQ